MSVSAWRGQLAPGHDRDSDGFLTIAGHRIDDLASRFSTPSFFLDTRVLEANVQRYVSLASARNMHVSYASKALSLTRLLQRMAHHDIGIDVASLGEWKTAQRAGFAPERMTLHGAGKTDDEIDLAIHGHVGRLVVDSIDELRRLIARSEAPQCNVLLRINTGVEAHTHEYIRTAGDSSKFGIPPREEGDAIRLLREKPSIHAVGLHGHAGSQIEQREAFVAHCTSLAEALARFRDAGCTMNTVITGGGFPVRMHPDEPESPLDVAEIIASIARAFPDDVTVEIEPGRAIVADAATTVYRVMAVKRFSRRTFVVIDGSLADNPRRLLYGASHHVVEGRARSTPRLPVTVCGRACENDEMADAALPSDVHEGELLAMCVTGAYTFSMASNYNRFLRPPLVALEPGSFETYAPRQTLEALLSGDAV